MAIFQDLVDGHGFSGKYPSVKRFVRNCVDHRRRKPAW
jgi:hypothetical protein